MPAAVRKQSPSEGGSEAEHDIIAAAKAGDTDRVRDILQRLPNSISVTDTNGFTALHYACFHSNFFLVQLLLAQPRVDCLARDVWGRLPLFYALTSPNAELKNAVRRKTFPAKPESV